MNIAKSVNIARLVTAYNLQIDSAMLPDNLKCVKCKLVLTDACQVPCGCRFCRACIDEMMASGSEFCPGLSEDCGESLLSGFATDYSSNKSISRLAMKCPKSGCVFECRLAEIEAHMRVCGRKSAACPFYEWGCQQDKLGTEEMSEHFQQENRSHCEILIGMIADITREMQMQKREIEVLKRSDESKKSEIEMLKHELMLKNGQIMSLIDQVGHVENEIKSMKQEKDDLTDRVRILSEKIDQEIDERRENDERDIVNVIEHVDREITAIAGMIGSNKDEVDTTRCVRDDIRSINRDCINLVMNDIDCIKSQLQSIQALVGLGQVDASFEWLIDVNITKIRWDWNWGSSRKSDSFTGAVYQYKYQLVSWNIESNAGGTFWICLLIVPGPCDARLIWPFRGTVAITVSDKGNSKACQNIVRQCEIGKPKDNNHTYNAAFSYSHSSLIEAGLDLGRGMWVSCVIVPSITGR